MEHVERLRKYGVLFRSYLDAGRHLVRLALPSVLVHVPLAALSLLALTVTAGDSAALVNQQFQLIGTSDAPLLIWTLVPAAIALAGEIVVFPATVIMATGHLVDQHVSPVEALRATVRRLPSLLVLLLIAALAFGATGAAGAGVLMATDQQWLATVVLVVAAYAAMPGLLAVPGILLHGCSGLDSIRRAYRLTELSFLPTALTMAFGVFLVPGATMWALESGLRLLPDPLATIGWGLVGTVLALAITPFQAAVVARQFLHCMAWRTEVNDSNLAHGLPKATLSRPVRPILLLAALLPGLLFSGVVLLNPFGWLEVAETNITESWQPAGRSGSSEDRDPELRPMDLRDVHPGLGTGLTMVIDGFEDYASLLACSDASCQKTTFTWAEPPSANTDGAPGAVSARLPDGRLLLTTWSHQALRLLTCEANKCVPAPGNWNIARANYPAEYTGVALAVRQGGGLVIAFADKEQVKGDTSPTKDIVSLISCADVSCSRPETKQVAHLDASAYLSDVHNLAVAMAPGDRPVAARFDTTSGQIHVISCADAACLQPRVTRPVPPYPTSVNDRLGLEPGLSLAVRADGHPVIAYRDMNDHATKLLDCRTSDCAQADVITLDAGGPYRTTPALVLDRVGRPLVAYQNQDGTRLMLATCTGRRCESTAVARMRGAGEGLAMTMNSEGKPMIAWIDDGGSLLGGEWALIVTTPLSLTAD
ncbi:hypothetical protein [Nonomuraea aurantiaca]|uniref:hypothetical protein n=1 Tax=Nonomuraea aurantiaca TaxID=2878562 RepID=UPI001CDA3727|nr:hypothetical protein [Nonomuraea aurantiaca]MCA2228199.1 hypothetical protein [Nonomuraea aurantiaca]